MRGLIILYLNSSPNGIYFGMRLLICSYWESHTPSQIDSKSLELCSNYLIIDSVSLSKSKYFDRIVPSKVDCMNH